MTESPRPRTAQIPFRKWFPFMILVLILALTAVWLMARSTPVNPDALKKPAAGASG